MKRFYTLVSTEKTGDSGYGIFLDGKPVKTRAGRLLSAPNLDVANKVVREWSAQEDRVEPDTMPFTQILNTKIDRVADARAAISASILKYLDTDLICYPAPEPDELCSRQEKYWQPHRNWFNQHFGCNLLVTTDLQALSQPQELHNIVRDYVDSLNDDLFTILQLVTSLSGSLILSLAFVNGQASAKDVFDARFVEENYKSDLYNADKYGVDPSLEKSQEQIMRDLTAAGEYLELL